MKHEDSSASSLPHDLIDRALSESMPATRRMRLPAHGMLGVPEQIANYSILVRIGHGGMANVYLARQWGPEGFARNVALKLLSPKRQEDPAYVRMFRDEARLGALIDHPNVCRVIDFGEADGHHFIALEYLVGESFAKLMTRLAQRKEWLQSTRYFATLARMIAQCCDGLHAAHQALDAHGRALNVVHRDVSPHNLFALYDGSTRVVDFGVARYDLREYATTVKMLRGKVAYMSPEHITGQEVDCRSDVWSMGVVLWEMLTGERLFRRETEIDVMRAVALKPVPHPRRRNEHAPHGLSRIALCALNRDPDARYQTAAAMAAELEAYAASTGVATHSSAVRAFLIDAFPEGEQRKLELLARFKGVQNSGTFPRGAETSEHDSLPPPVLIPPLPGDSEPPGAEPTVVEPRRRSGHVEPESTISEPPPTLPDPDPEEDDEPTAVLQPARSVPPIKRSVPPLPLVRRKRPRRRDAALWAAALGLPLLSGWLAYTAVKSQRTRLAEVTYQEAPRAQQGMHTLQLPVAQVPTSSDSETRDRQSPAPPVIAESAEISSPQRSQPEKRKARIAAKSTAPTTHHAALERAQPEEARRIAGTGDLVVTSAERGVPVFRDGNFLGVTPLRVRLPQGVQHLEARYADGRKANLSTQVRAGALSLLTLPE